MTIIILEHAIRYFSCNASFKYGTSYHQFNILAFLLTSLNFSNANFKALLKSAWPDASSLSTSLSSCWNVMRGTFFYICFCHLSSVTKKNLFFFLINTPLLLFDYHLNSLTFLNEGKCSGMFYAIQGEKF